VATDELSDPSLHFVMTDNRFAAATATRHLIELGHRKIGHIHSPSRSTWLKSDRLLGYYDAMTAARLDVAPGWVIDGDFSMESGERAGHAFLALDNRPTAIFSANDEMLLGFLSVLRDAGIECPRDISAIGFDDITVARCFTPALTTMRQPRADIGRIATKALLDILDGTLVQRTPLRLILKSELVVRNSTAPLTV